MDDTEPRRMPPVLGDEYDFAARVRRDPRLYNLVTYTVGVL